MSKIPQELMDALERTFEEAKKQGDVLGGDKEREPAEPVKVTRTFKGETSTDEYSFLFMLGVTDTTDTGMHVHVVKMGRASIQERMNIIHELENSIIPDMKREIMQQGLGIPGSLLGLLGSLLEDE